MKKPAWAADSIPVSLYESPASIVERFPQFPVTRSYAELKAAIDAAAADLLND